MTRPLLTTKFYIPPARSELVPRKRLMQRLDDGLRLGHRLILLSAPAGFGKTTLLSDWIRSQKRSTVSPRVAWLSLDEGDNDPARFAAYLLAAVQRAGIDLDPDERGLLAVPPALGEPLLTALLNEVASSSQPLVLVLDDYHLVTAPAIHEGVAFLLEHLPGNAYLAIASRADPPLAVARLRGRGQLTELRQADLRFHLDEVARFLNESLALQLDPGQVAALASRTEGWIAGLQMAVLSLQRHRQVQDRSALSDSIEALTGSHRFILDYLVEEVLDQQPPAIQNFLLKTSILERLSGPLCDCLLEPDDDGPPEPNAPATPGLPLADRRSPGQQILKQLEAANLFIVPLDDERRWYRYHRLFSDLLRQRLQQYRPELVPGLHRRASEWHERQGLVAAAIEHALAAGDLERAAVLIERATESILMRSQVATFQSWIERLPEDLMTAHPTLCFYHAWTLVMSGGSLDEVEQRLEAIACLEEEASEPSSISARLVFLQAYLAILRGDIPRAAQLCHQVLAELPEADVFLRNLASWILGLTRLAEGTLEESGRDLQEIASQSREIGNILIAVTAICQRARLRMRGGHLRRAGEILEQALRLATDPYGQPLPIASEAHLGLGQLALEWNDRDQAAVHLEKAIELSRQWSEMAGLEAYLHLARVRQAQGDGVGARAAANRARQLAQKSEGTQLDDLIAELQWARLCVVQGNLAGVRRWARRRGLLSGDAAGPRSELDESLRYVHRRLQKYEHLILAWLWIEEGKSQVALALLEPLLAPMEDLGRVDLLIGIQILRALAHRAQGRKSEALAALAEALDHAEPGGYVYTFVEVGEPILDLLRQAAAQGLRPAYVRTLIEAFERPAPTGQAAQIQVLVEPLSERELEVLGLLATGMSNPEIADHLYIAVSTVRSHCKNIYGKLNVHKRWDAVQRAEELGLLS